MTLRSLSLAIVLLGLSAGATEANANGDQKRHQFLAEIRRAHPGKLWDDDVEWLAAYEARYQGVFGKAPPVEPAPPPLPGPDSFLPKILSFGREFQLLNEMAAGYNSLLKRGFRPPQLPPVAYQKDREKYGEEARLGKAFPIQTPEEKKALEAVALYWILKGPAAFHRHPMVPMLVYKGYEAGSLDLSKETSVTRVFREFAAQCQYVWKRKGKELPPFPPQVRSMRSRVEDWAKKHGRYDLTPEQEQARGQQAERARFFAILERVREGQVVTPEATSWALKYERAQRGLPLGARLPSWAEASYLGAKALVGNRAAYEAQQAAKAKEAQRINDLRAKIAGVHSGWLPAGIDGLMREAASLRMDQLQRQLTDKIQPHQATSNQVAVLRESGLSYEASRVQKLLDQRGAAQAAAAPRGAPQAYVPPGRFTTPRARDGLVGAVDAQVERLRRQAAEKEARRREAEAWRSKTPYGQR